MFEWAMETGFLKSEKQGFYQFNLDGWVDGKSYRRKDIEANYTKFFDDLLKNDQFKKLVKDMYMLGGPNERGEGEASMVVDSETGEIL
jgi:hypothetical protein